MARIITYYVPRQHLEKPAKPAEKRGQLIEFAAAARRIAVRHAWRDVERQAGVAR